MQDSGQKGKTGQNVIDLPEYQCDITIYRANRQQYFQDNERYLPGPYTFILKSNKYVQKFFKNNKEEIGVRIPKSEILDALQEFLEAPLISTSLNTHNGVQNYFTDPDEIENVFQHTVDMLLDGGNGDNAESTVLDCTVEEIELIREGKGQVD